MTKQRKSDGIGRSGKVEGRQRGEEEIETMGGI